MATIADLVIKVRADTGVAEKEISSFGSKVGSGIKKSMVPAVAALGGLAVVGKLAWGNMVDGAKNAKQTEAVLKSTGGAAGVTAKHVDDLAMSLRRKAGVDDDVVHSGENMLLTFTNVRNEAGKGNDIFDQATKTMLDMSTALGQDTKSSAIQLGKALNDPVKGVTALQRVGVSFTAQQKEQIKTLVASGHTLEAQKLILGELNKEFGGSAEHVDPFQKSLNNLKLDLTDIATSVLQALLPALQMLVGWLGKGAQWAQKHTTAVKIGAIAVAGLSAAIIVLNAAMAANPVVLVVAALAALAVGLYVLYQKSETFRNAVNNLASTLRGVLAGAINFIKALWDQFGSDITAAAKLFGGAILDSLQNTFQIIEGIFHVFHGLLTGDWSELWNGLKDIFGGVWGQIKGAINLAWNALKIELDVAWKLITGAATIAWNAIKTAMTTPIEAAKTLLSTAFNAIKTVATTAWNATKTAATTTWNAIKTAVTTPVNAAKTAVTTAINAIKTTVSSVFGALSGTVSREWNNIKSAITGAINTAKGVVVGAVNAIKGALNDTFHAFESVGSKLKSLIIAPINFVIDKLNAIHIPGFSVHIPGLSVMGHQVFGGADIGWGGLDPFHIPKLAVGTDFVASDGLAMLHRGEAVVPAEVAGGGFSGGGIRVEGDLVIREEVDIDRVAARLGRRLAVAGI